MFTGSTKHRPQNDKSYNKHSSWLLTICESFQNYESVLCVQLTEIPFLRVTTISCVMSLLPSTHEVRNIWVHITLYTISGFVRINNTRLFSHPRRSPLMILSHLIFLSDKIYNINDGTNNHRSLTVPW